MRETKKIEMLILRKMYSLSQKQHVGVSFQVVRIRQKSV